MECYSALKSKEILTHATTWMNHEYLMLIEINRYKRTKKKNSVHIQMYQKPRLIILKLLCLLKYLKTPVMISGK